MSKSSTKLLSKKTLFMNLAALAAAHPEHLGAFADVAAKGLKHAKVSDETYGRKSCVYLDAGKEIRAWLEGQLAKLGHKVQPEYWPGSGSLEVRVSYFKGWHCDE